MSTLHLSLTAQETLGSLAAILAFAAVLYAPGYLLAHAADLFNFRRLSLAHRSLWAIATSFALSPILAYAIGRTAGLTTLCWLFAAASLATLTLLLRSRNTPPWPPQSRHLTLLIAAGWIVFVLLTLVDLQLGHRLYFSVVMADQSYRIAFTDTVLRTGLPPANPLYFDGAAAPMRYYYFWYILCAAAAKIAHVTAQQAFIASTVWAGFGLLAAVKLFAAHFFHWSRRTTHIALALLAVTGADILPSLGNAILQPTLNGDIEWWSVDPIDAWPDSLLWVPHHVAAVLGCLFAFLLLWNTLQATATPRARRSAIVLSAIAFASAFGLSVYVAFGFALMVLAWLLRLILQRNPLRWPILRNTTAAALLSAALLLPFLLELTGPHTLGTQPTAHLFALSVRPLIDSGLLTGLPLFAALNSTHPHLLDQTIRLLLLPPGLAMELGLYGFLLVLLLIAKRRPNTALTTNRAFAFLSVIPGGNLLFDRSGNNSLPPDDARDTALFLTLFGLLMTLFLASSVITNNDFGYRAVMLPQFFLTLLSAELLSTWFPAAANSSPSQLPVFRRHPRAQSAKDPRILPAPPHIPLTPNRRRITLTLLTLGLLGTAYGAVLLRAWLPLEARFQRHGYDRLSADAFQLHELFATLHHSAPSNAVLAFNPPGPQPDRGSAVMTPTDFYQRMIVMDANLQFLNAEQKCAVQFGGSPAPCHDIQTATAQLYASPAPDAAHARAFCARFGVQYLFIGHHEPAWPNTTGWPNTLPIVAAEPGFAILSCAP